MEGRRRGAGRACRLAYCGLYCRNGRGLAPDPLDFNLAGKLHSRGGRGGPHGGQNYHNQYNKKGRGYRRFRIGFCIRRAEAA